MAIEDALADVREGRNDRRAPAHQGRQRQESHELKRLAARGKEQGAAYNYTPRPRGSGPGSSAWSGAQDYLGVNKSYYKPTDHGAGRSS